jgi:rubrerythrin
MADTTLHLRPELVVPPGGFVPAPEVPQPNIYPMEWRVDSPKLAELYERSKKQLWNPSDFPWDTLRAEDFTVEQRLGIMYWYAVLANFDGSGPAVFAKATIHAFEMHEEDPIRKCFFSITRDEMNHEECCQRVIQKLWPGGPLDFEPKSDLEAAATNNIGWLYHNGGRYWSGYSQSLNKYPFSVLFTSFLMGEIAASTLFFGMSKKATNSVFQNMFKRVGQDEARHLAICLTVLEKDWPGLSDEYKTMITKQIRAGFVFLSMILWEPPNQFWELPDYFLANHRVLIQHARDAGLGVLTYDEQAENWRTALARCRAIVGEWGIQFPAIPELDLDGVDVGDIGPEDIIPVF